MCSHLAWTSWPRRSAPRESSPRFTTIPNMKRLLTRRPATTRRARKARSSSLVIRWELTRLSTWPIDWAPLGIPVKLVVPFDPVDPTAAGGNIARVVNLYISDGVGRSVARGPSFRGVLENIDLKGHVDVGHMS